MDKIIRAVRALTQMKSLAYEIKKMQIKDNPELTRALKNSPAFRQACFAFKDFKDNAINRLDEIILGHKKDDNKKIGKKK